MAISDTLKLLSAKVQKLPGEFVERIHTTGRETPLDNQVATDLRGIKIEEGAFSSTTIGDTTLTDQELSILTGTELRKRSFVETAQQRVAQFVNPQEHTPVVIVAKVAQPHTTLPAHVSVNDSDDKLARIAGSKAALDAIKGLSNANASDASHATKTQRPAASVARATHTGPQTGNQTSNSL